MNPAQPLSTAPPAPLAFRKRLLHKYVGYFAAVVCLALVSNAAFDSWFYYHAYRDLLISIQRAQAEDAAGKIKRTFGEIESQIGWITAQGFDARSIEDWRFDLARLLHQAPAISAVAKVDAAGREHLRLSRNASEAAGAGDVSPLRDVGTGKARYGPVEVRGATESITVALAGAGGGAAVAEIDLKFIFDAVAGMKLIENGEIYLLDAGNRLIFHSHPASAGRDTDFSLLAQVRAARAPDAPARDTFEDPGGRAMLSVFAAVAPLDWLVFVELPVAAAHAPLLLLLLRSGVHLTLALVLAVLAGLLLSRRMVGPIETLRAGAARVGAGDLDHRITVETRDELGALGDQFNRMAAQLAESYASLEGKVAARTEDLARANLAKSRFLAVASHDLRQPLHALGLFVAELRAQSLSSAGRRIAERIDAAVAAMNELFAALLDISKLDAGVLAPAFTGFPVAHLLGRIEATFAAAAREKGLSLRLVASSAVVFSDVILLERILINLVANAVRYTAHGGVVVGCRRRGRNLRIEVWDTGPGIAAQHQQEIFAEFSQLAAPGADRHGGLGLGLAIVERLCALLGHRVALRSTPARGACFSVEVPLAAVQRLVEPVADLPGSLPAGKTIVVLDDDALVRQGMSGLLRSWGCGVVAASGAREAAAELGARAPDLVISDYHLAGGATGIAAIAELRALWHAPIAAFLISADIAPERLREARASGCRLVHKPVRPMVLRAMVMQFLRAPDVAAAE